jgi:hypothetical protein
MSIEYIKQLCKFKATVTASPGLIADDPGQVTIARVDGSKMFYTYSHKSNDQIKSEIEAFIEGSKYIRSYGSE